MIYCINSENGKYLFLVNTTGNTNYTSASLKAYVIQHFNSSSSGGGGGQTTTILTTIPQNTIIPTQIIPNLNLVYLFYNTSFMIYGINLFFAWLVLLFLSVLFIVSSKHSKIRTISIILIILIVLIYVFYVIIGSL